MLTTYIISGNLAEWLRRKIRNLLVFARAGSSPAVVDNFFKKIVKILSFSIKDFLCNKLINILQKK